MAPFNLRALSGNGYPKIACQLILVCKNALNLCYRKGGECVLSSRWHLIARTETTIRRMRNCVEKLSGNLVYYLDKFDEANIFTGPSLFFHFRTLDRLKHLGALSAAFEDTLFFEYLYATLASWGLHRMGDTATKMVDFESFQSSLQAKKDDIVVLQGYKLTQLSEVDLKTVTETLGNILSNIKISASKTQLVAGSKALHHLLPKLMPPIDRQYTKIFLPKERNQIH